MESVQVPDERASLSVENVGGIEEAEVALEPGVNVLVGRNATNRTSLLQALMAALGSDRASLKGDAERGRVRLEFAGEAYTRTLTRDGDDVVLGGSPYLEDGTSAELFAFLLESNEARRAVERGDDLREVIMRPVDTAEVRAEVDRLESRKRDLEERLDDRDRLEAEVERLEEACRELEAEVERTEAALAEKRAAVEEADADLEASREGKAELDEKLADLQDARSTLEDVTFRLGTERETREELRAELSAVEDDLDDLPAAPSDELSGVESRIESLHERKRRFDSTVNQLQALIEFNEEMLDGDGGLDVLAADEDVTERLLPRGGSFTCWTCGGETARDEVEETLDWLREQRRELIARRREVTDDLEAAKARKRDLADQRDRRRDLERRRDDLRTELADVEDEIDRLTERRAELESTVEDLEAAVEELREEEYSDLVERHREASEAELELESVRDELERRERALAERREQLAELSDLSSELESVRGRLDDARSRIERLESEAVAAFNEHMETVLDLLDYDNIDRIWIERVDRGADAGTLDGGRFELHVVRSTEDGAVYEDTVDHLSESEREVTGLVFALAGYLAHEAYETTPFVVLDSLEAIDSDRIATLVDYVAEYAGFLVAALLPEDARALDDGYRHVSEF